MAAMEWPSGCCCEAQQGGLSMTLHHGQLYGGIEILYQRMSVTLNKDMVINSRLVHDDNYLMMYVPDSGLLHGCMGSVLMVNSGHLVDARCRYPVIHQFKI